MNFMSDNDVKYAKIRDKRLEKRLFRIIEVLSQNPSGSIPEACCSHAETMATYRFISNDKVEATGIRDSFISSTVRRIEKEEVVLLPTDATSISFSNHKGLKGAGHLVDEKSLGFMMHSTIALTEEGVPLGLLYQEVWSRNIELFGKGKKEERRKLPVELRESYKWISAVHAANTFVPKATTAIVICDRGADFYDLFAANRAPNVELLVRVAVNRKLHGTNLQLFERLSDEKPAGNISVKVPRSRNSPLRKALLEVRYTKVEIKPPRRRLGALSIALYAIEAKEIDFQQTITRPILWRLFTTFPILSLEEAHRQINRYAMRWKIERYHYVLKSGCRVEELQLEFADRLQKALAIYCIVAWKLLFIMYQSRITPSEPCNKFFAEHEWKACYFFLKKSKPPKKPPSLKEFVLILAKLGGFLGRKGDGDPGVKVLWRGLRRMEDISEAYTVFTGKDVCNG